MAARGARAIGRADAPAWRAHALSRRRSGSACPRRGPPAGVAGMGLDRRTQPTDRLALQPGRSRPLSNIGGRTDCLGARHPGHVWARGADNAASDPTILIVFAGLNDPVSAGYVANLARPGGNMTGFATAPWSISGKWLDLLKQIAPRVTRVAVIRDPGGPGGAGQFGALQGMAASLGLEVSPIDASVPV